MTKGINQDRARGKSKGRGTGDDITQSTTDENPQGSPSGNPKTAKQGRPKTIENPHRTTMTLEKRQVDHLDRICAKIKLAGGENLSRSNVVRALLDALVDSDLEYSEIRSEEKLREVLEELFR